MSTHNLCFEQKCEKYLFFIRKFSVFRSEIFYIFVEACFRNDWHCLGMVSSIIKGHGSGVCLWGGGGGGGGGGGARVAYIAAICSVSFNRDSDFSILYVRCFQEQHTRREREGGGAGWVGEGVCGLLTLLPYEVSHSTEPPISVYCMFGVSKSNTPDERGRGGGGGGGRGRVGGLLTLLPYGVSHSTETPISVSCMFGVSKSNLSGFY